MINEIVGAKPEQEELNFTDQIRGYLHKEIEWNDEEKPMSRFLRYNNLPTSIKSGGLVMRYLIAKEMSEIAPTEKNNQGFAEAKQTSEKIKKAMEKADLKSVEVKDYDMVFVGPNASSDVSFRSEEDFKYLQMFLEKVEQVYLDLRKQGLTAEEIRQ